MIFLIHTYNQVVIIFVFSQEHFPFSSSLSFLFRNLSTSYFYNYFWCDVGGHLIFSSECNMPNTHYTTICKSQQDNKIRQNSNYSFFSATDSACAWYYMRFNLRLHVSFGKIAKHGWNQNNPLHMFTRVAK